MNVKITAHGPVIQYGYLEIKIEDEIHAKDEADLLKRVERTLQLVREAVSDLPGSDCAQFSQNIGGGPPFWTDDIDAEKQALGEPVEE